MLDAGIDVISTVNVQHLESLNDEIAELTGVRVRETFPDHILEDADEVVLVDLTPEALQERLRAGKVYRRIEPTWRYRTSSAPTSSRGCASSRSVRSPKTSKPAGWGTCWTLSANRRSPSGCWRWSSRSRSHSGSCAAPGVRPNGSARSSTPSGCDRAGTVTDRGAGVALAALRRLSIVLGAHFLEEEGDDLVAVVRRVVYERGRRTCSSARRTRAAGARSSAGRCSPRSSGSFRVSTSGSSRTEPTAAVAESSGDRARSSLGARSWARSPRRSPAAPAVDGFRSARQRRILVPFPGTSTRPCSMRRSGSPEAEEAVLVPAYLLIVPLALRRGLAAQRGGEVAMPLLEAVEHAALRAGVPVDARIEKGRTPTHALSGSGRWSSSTESSRRRRRTAGAAAFPKKELAWFYARSEPRRWC